MSEFDIYSGKVRVRSCGLIKRNEELLLVKQSVPTKNHPVWILPGGGVQFAEESEKALIREVYEETGLNISPHRLRYVHEFIQGTFHSIELYYICDILSGTIKTGSDPEHDKNQQLIIDVAWHSLNRISQIELFPEFLRDDAQKGSLFDDVISYFKTA